MKETVWPAVLSRDAPRRNTHPGLSNTGGPSGAATIAQHNSAEVPRPENRWTGVNRGGWSHPDFDPLAATFNTTLDRTERTRLPVQMARIFTDDAAAISLYFNLNVTAFSAGLKGPGTAVPESDIAWNVYEWEFR